jgi:hypothetical protein
MKNPVVGTVVPLTINVHSDSLERAMSTMKRAGMVIDALRAERDELLAALTACVEAWEYYLPDGCGKSTARPMPNFLEVAYSLIAKHEGKEQK